MEALCSDRCGVSCGFREWWRSTTETRVRWQHRLGRTDVFISQMLLAGVARESLFHMLICSAWCFHVPQRHLMLLKHHDNLAVFGIRRFSISWACCICWFIWQEKQWFIVMSSTSQVKQKNILIVVMCCHLYTRETIRENLPNFQCKLSLGCSVINQQTVTLALGCIGTLHDCWAKNEAILSVLP